MVVVVLVVVVRGSVFTVVFDSARTGVYAVVMVMVMGIGMGIG